MGKKLFLKTEIYENKCPSSLDVVMFPHKGWSCCSHVAGTRYTTPKMLSMAEEKENVLGY